MFKCGQLKKLSDMTQGEAKGCELSFWSDIFSQVRCIALPDAMMLFLSVSLIVTRHSSGDNKLGITVERSPKK